MSINHNWLNGLPTFIQLGGKLKAECPPATIHHGTILLPQVAQAVNRSETTNAYYGWFCQRKKCSIFDANHPMRWLCSTFRPSFPSLEDIQVIIAEAKDLRPH
jgi:hypothetical protein